LGIGNPGDKNVGFLISTTMNPLTTDTIKGDFREDIEVALRQAIYRAIQKLTADARTAVYSLRGEPAFDPA